MGITAFTRFEAPRIVVCYAWLFFYDTCYSSFSDLPMISFMISVVPP